MMAPTALLSDRGADEGRQPFLSKLEVIDQSSEEGGSPANTFGIRLNSDESSAGQIPSVATSRQGPFDQPIYIKEGVLQDETPVAATLS